MRFNTNFKLFSLFLSLSVAAPMAQYSEVVSAGNPIDVGIDSSSNNLLTGTSSQDMGADLMAARRQGGRSRRRPPDQPILRPPIPNTNTCPVDSTGSSCQPEGKPTTIPAPGQEEIPDPWLDELGNVEGSVEGGLGFWGLWNILDRLDPVLSD